MVVLIGKCGRADGVEGGGTAASAHTSHHHTAPAFRWLGLRLRLGLRLGLGLGLGLRIRLDLVRAFLRPFAQPLLLCESFGLLPFCGKLSLCCRRFSLLG